MIIINCENQILGRLASFVAKQALLGQEVKVVNCKDAVVSGKRPAIIARYQKTKARGIPLKGPYYPRLPEMIVKRTIRGMLPYKQEKGLSAFKRVLCYRGMPEEFSGKDIVSVPGADISKVKKTNYIKVIEISRELGAKL